jgi:hypothetical protein
MSDDARVDFVEARLEADGAIVLGVVLVSFFVDEADCGHLPHTGDASMGPTEVEALLQHWHQLVLEPFKDSVRYSVETRAG